MRKCFIIDYEKDLKHKKLILNEIKEYLPINDIKSRQSIIEKSKISF